MTIHRGAREWRPLFVAMLAAVSLAACTTPAPHRHLLIVVDGLRPDYVTAEVMPALTALGQRGVVFAKHHAVYPTVTRVNASSISTGAYPGMHGLMGNTVYFPRVAAKTFLDTSDLDSLQAIAASEGRLLTAQTLGQTLQSAGRRLLVVSSGSGGSAFLNNSLVSGGAILHASYTMPAVLGAYMAAIGPRPTTGTAPAELDRYAVDALLKVGLPRVDPAVAIVWLGALDSVAHDKGLGDPATIQVLRDVDAQIARIQDGLRAAGALDDWNIWVTSDHGFSTHAGAADVGALLQPYARTLPDGTPRIMSSGGAIYVRDHDDAAVSGIVAALQRTAGIGAIFTASERAGSLDGRIPGTLSLDAVRWTHPRSAEILYSADWTDTPNGNGVPGTAAASGVAGHGSSSPREIHNTLIAAGPDLKRGVTSDVPSANVDFAPTFLTLLGVPFPPSMQGRALEESLAASRADAVRAGRTTTHTAGTKDGSYTVTGTFSEVETPGRRYRYFDGARVSRR